MKYRSLPVICMVSLLFGSAVLARPEQRPKDSNELKHLKKSAELKERLFKWQLEKPENLDFCIAKMLRLRHARQEIERIVVRLETLKLSVKDQKIKK